eukprot:scaffold285693_cov13-Tisochrysis_lutea.AAC.1
MQGIEAIPPASSCYAVLLPAVLLAVPVAGVLLEFAGCLTGVCFRVGSMLAMTLNRHSPRVVSCRAGMLGC